MLSKPETPEEAADHLRRMAGTRHRLFSAAVAARDGAPVWRAIGEAKLWMRPLSDAFIADYVAQNWDSIRWTVGCYEIEGAGVNCSNGSRATPGDRKSTRLHSSHQFPTRMPA